MNADQIIIDPRIRDFLPPLTAEQLAGLERNILADGRITDKLVVWRGNGTLIDGHNRRDIAERHGLAVEVVEVDLPDLPAVFAWMLARQEGQRAWTPYLRSESALKMKAAVAELAAERERAGKVDPRPNSDEGQDERRTDSVVAKAAGVGRSTVRSVEKIQAAAVPELKALAKTSAVAVDAAAKVASLPEVEQQAVVAGGAKAVKAKAAEIRKAAKAAKPAKSRPAATTPAPVASAPVEDAAEVVSPPTVRLTGGVDPDDYQPEDPNADWADFEKAIRVEVGVLRGVAERLRKALDYDSTEKRLRSPWAHYYSHAGTVAQVNTLVRQLAAGIPARIDPKPPGYVSHGFAAIRDKN